MTYRRDAIALTTALRQGETTAVAITAATLARIEQHNPALNCFTTVTAERAIAQAQAIDAALAAGEPVGPLAGVPFAVKNLYDIAGEVTLAGAKINASNAPATQDCTAIARLEAAGAILVGALNMDEYAYGFVTVNHHYGATPNPHDPARVSGGSSGGSAAAVAASLVPLTLGSDTNGSIRVPAALCGVYGFKPTYGRLSRAGTQLFSASLDHIGPLATTVEDIALAFDALQGPDPRDPVCCDRPIAPVTPHLQAGVQAGVDGLRIAIAAGHFAQGMEPAVATALETVATALQVTQRVTLPASDRARAAAYLITAAEGSQLHLSRLRSCPIDFDPATRDRFLAGAMIPASWYLQAQRLRRWYRDQVRSLFTEVDILLAPTTPCVAPYIDQDTMAIDGQDILVRPHLGLYTQPLSFIGLPVLSVPVPQPQGLPVGVQIMGAPYQEAKILRVAAALQAQGVISASLTHAT
ncbi:MAG: AtzE family amidohydrolase [Cyanobacteria bacterium]|nr:AtzE family amidohydrolase [Cyanobacteriota bacterium]MDA0867087.1 AtzE family amidohydrolase [Cyanobacteriota bacterium]